MRPHSRHQAASTGAPPLGTDGGALETGLEICNVSRHYGGVRALDRVTFAVQPGRIHGLIGPNGAGKTTLINCLSGLVPPSQGTIIYRGHHIEGLPPHRIAALGITRTYQNIRLFPAMTVLEHVLVGQHLTRATPFWQRLIWAPAERRSSSEARQAALALLALVGLEDRHDRPGSSLPYAAQRRLEIARALAAEPSLLLLDEPTAGMHGPEIDRLAQIIRSLSSSGRTILLVEHNMPLVMSLCDSLTVLNFGQVLADGSPDAITRDPAVIAAYLGSDE